MKQRRALQGFLVALTGVALACAPMTVASAKSHKSHKTSTSKTGSNPGSALCTALRTEEGSSSKLGSSVESAIASGNFATAKQAMINVLNEGLKEEGPALNVLKSAPANVQAAMKGLFKFENSFKSAIENATSLTNLETSFAALGTTPGLETDGTTVANYVTSQCGSLTTTT